MTSSLGPTKLQKCPLEPPKRASRLHGVLVFENEKFYEFLQKCYRKYRFWTRKCLPKRPQKHPKSIPGQPAPRLDEVLGLRFVCKLRRICACALRWTKISSSFRSRNSIRILTPFYIVFRSPKAPSMTPRTFKTSLSRALRAIFRKPLKWGGGVARSVFDNRNEKYKIHNSGKIRKVANFEAVRKNV